MSFLDKIRKGLHHKRAREAFAAGDLERAEHYFALLSRDYPQTRGFARSLALIRRSLGKFEDARSFFLADIEENGESADRYGELAELEYQAGNRDAAAQYYRELVRMVEESATGEGEFLLELARKRIDICEHPDRYASARRAKELFREALASLREQQHDRALRYLRATVEADPTHFQALNNLGVLLLNIEEDPKAAVEVFEQAAELSPSESIRGNLERASALLG
jgi:tetratricopeptide (TPR) repeat protein